jgi:hypothetical protein
VARNYVQDIVDTQSTVWDKTHTAINQVLFFMVPRNIRSESEMFIISMNGKHIIVNNEICHWLTVTSRRSCSEVECWCVGCVCVRGDVWVCVLCAIMKTVRTNLSLCLFDPR